MFTRFMSDPGYEFDWPGSSCPGHFDAFLDQQYERLTYSEGSGHLDMPMVEITKISALSRTLQTTAPDAQRE